MKITEHHPDRPPKTYYTEKGVRIEVDGSITVSKDVDQKRMDLRLKRVLEFVNNSSK